jgi:hypothetical protein
MLVSFVHLWLPNSCTRIAGSVSWKSVNSVLQYQGVERRVCNMSVKQETGQDDPENKGNIQSLLPRMPLLIPLPQPGQWLPQTKAGRDNIKTEHYDIPSEKETLYLKCSSCLNFVHSSLVLSCDLGYLLCLPCCSVIALALQHLPLNRGQIYRLEPIVTAENQKCERGFGETCLCGGSS